MMRLRVVAMWWFSGVLAIPLSAQSSTCVVPASDRMLPGGIGATLWPIDADAPDTGYSAKMLEAIHEAYQIGTPLTLGEYSVHDSVAAASAYASIEFVRTAAGSVEDARVVGSSLSPVFDSVAVDAVQAAGAAGLPAVAAGAFKNVRYRLELYVFANRDTLFKSGGPIPRSVHARWVDTNVPGWGDAQPVRVIKSGGTPEYPDVARRAGVGDSLQVVFAVGANGRVTPGTGVVVRGTYHEFVEVVARWLSAKTFQPATIRGCPVTATVLEPFVFKMER
jgi:hypothetical protein